MDVEIFIKPECKNNKKQVEMLKEKGHTVTVKNIFETQWSEASLQPFFKQLPLEKWHNPYAPRIKSGEVTLDNLSADAVLKEMLADNYLIRRPLLRVGNRYDCGFDSELAKELMGDSDVSEVLACHQAGNVCE